VHANIVEKDLNQFKKVVSYLQETFMT